MKILITGKIANCIKEWRKSENLKMEEGIKNKTGREKEHKMKRKINNQ